jgi:cysteine desulfurase
MNQIYLDNNATTPILPEVAEAMHECSLRNYANPASQHQAGRRARKLLEETREKIAALLGARTDGLDTDRVIFTSGGTESNNLALRGLCGEPGSNLVISAIEHPSIAEVARYLHQQGYDVRVLPVDPSGVIRTETLDKLIDGQTCLVSVMLGNNETGVLQPVQEIAAICRAVDVPLHTDAVQAVGKITVDFRALEVSALSLSAHKLHGPRGIGALLLRHALPIRPILFGGFQQSGIRPSTESVSLAVGLLTALQAWDREADERRRRIQSLRDRFESRLREEVPSAVINGADAARLPHTTNISFPGLDRQAILMALDLAGVACSTGSACASGSSEPSPVLLAMHLNRAIVEGSIRISLGASTTAAEIDEAIRRITLVHQGLNADNSPRNAAVTSRH